MGFSDAGITKLSELSVDVSKDWAALLIRNLADPLLAQDAATKYYVDNLPPPSLLLSLLGIDVDKNWAAHLIKNLGAGVDLADAVQLQQAILQSAMTVYGDIIYRNATVADRLAPVSGIDHYYLRTMGPGAAPVWEDATDYIQQVTGLYRKFYSLVIPSPSIAMDAVENHSGGGFTSSPALTLPAPTVAKATALSSPNAMGGGIAHQNSPALDTDETAATNNATANDMHLLPAAAQSVGDGFYFGYASLWDWLAVNIGTAGAGTWTITWQYYNGATFTPLTLKYNETSNWRTSGLKRVHFVRPGDWATLDILGNTQYWIKATMTSWTSMTTQPLGTQAWCGYY